MRSDDEITSEILEASLSGLGLAAAQGLGKGLAAGAKAAAGAVGAIPAVSKAKGRVAAINAYTKLDKDWKRYLGTQKGAQPVHDDPVDQAAYDLSNFFLTAYGVDVRGPLQTVTQQIGLAPVTSGGSHAAPAAAGAAPAAPATPNAQPNGAPAAPAADKPSQAQPAQPAQAQAQPSQDQAARQKRAQEIANAALAKYPNGVPDPAAGGEKDADGNVVNRERPFYRHNSNTIDFDDPHLQPGQGDIRSNRQQRDDERLGRETNEPQRRTKPAKKKRTESLEPTSLTFSQIVAEADTAARKTVEVSDRKGAAAELSKEMLKAMARQIAASPAVYKGFMADKGLNGTSDKVGARTDASAASQGAAWNSPVPNRTTPKAIDRAAVNTILTRHLELNPERIEEIEREVRGLNPHDTVKKLRQVMTQDEALSFVAALLKTVEQ